MPRYLQTFEVTAFRKEFPIDMLRYDACYPANEHDSAEITFTMKPEAAVAQEAVTIHLSRVVDRKTQLPHFERWASFGWTVSRSKIRTVKL